MLNIITFLTRKKIYIYVSHYTSHIHTIYMSLSVREGLTVNNEYSKRQLYPLTFASLLDP